MPSVTIMDCASRGLHATCGLTTRGGAAVPCTRFFLDKSTMHGGVAQENKEVTRDASRLIILHVLARRSLNRSVMHASAAGCLDRAGHLVDMGN